MIVSNEIHAHIVGMCKGEIKDIHISSIVGVHTRTMQTVIKQFKECSQSKKSVALYRSFGMKTSLSFYLLHRHSKS